jgi:hypothetical protein
MRYGKGKTHLELQKEKPAYSQKYGKAVFDSTGSLFTYIFGGINRNTIKSDFIM